MHRIDRRILHLLHLPQTQTITKYSARSETKEFSSLSVEPVDDLGIGTYAKETRRIDPISRDETDGWMDGWMVKIDVDIPFSG